MAEDKKDTNAETHASQVQPRKRPEAREAGFTDREAPEAGSRSSEATDGHTGGGRGGRY